MSEEERFLGPFVRPVAPVAPLPDPPPSVSRRGHRLVCHALVVANLFFGMGIAYGYRWLTASDAPWPYEVKERRIMTPSVDPGGNLIQRRLVEYHEDCDIRYERRVQSSTVDGRRFIPDDQFFEHPPWDRSGQYQESSIPIPADFACGPAYLVEIATVACNWRERIVKRRRKPDIISPFTVSCQPPS